MIRRLNSCQQLINTARNCLLKWLTRFFRVLFFFYLFRFVIWIKKKTVFLNFSTEPRKEKTDVSNSSSGGNGNAGNNALSPNSEQSCQGSLLPPPGSGSLNNHLSTPKLERPNSLGGTNKISRRVICYRGDHCKYFHTILFHNYKSISFVCCPKMIFEFK